MNQTCKFNSPRADFLGWKAHGFPKSKGETMLSKIKRRGKSGIYYANTSHWGVRLRDSLKTVNPHEALRRLLELEIAVERGNYLKVKTKFDDLLKKYKPDSKRKEGIVRIQLVPEFSGKMLTEIDIEPWANKIAENYAQSSVGQIFAVMRELGFEVPSVKSKVPSKRFGIDQILDEEQVLDVIHNYVIDKYKAFCLIGAYSMLRLKDILNMRKMDVDLHRGITLVPSKTKGKNPDPVFIPMTDKLRNAFNLIKVWPMRDEDLWFPGFKSSCVTTAVITAFHKAGIPWGSFKQLRHFGACYLINHGIPLEFIQRLMHHKNIKTTQIYARVKRDKLVAAMSVFDTKVAQVVGR